MGCASPADACPADQGHAPRLARHFQRPPQTQLEHFEINACGGFQLSYYVEGLERHYQIGDEIALYASPEELVEKACYYLKHEDEREVVAQRGYERRLREHTMERRFRELFERMGLSMSESG